MSLEVYEGFRTYRPAYAGQGPIYSVDITVVPETCADGSTRVRALVIGGRVYEMQGRCND